MADLENALPPPPQEGTKNAPDAALTTEDSERR